MPAATTHSPSPKAAGGSQNPPIYDQTDGDFVVVAGTPPEAVGPASPVAAPAVAGQGGETSGGWEVVSVAKK